MIETKKGFFFGGGEIKAGQRMRHAIANICIYPQTLTFDAGQMMQNVRERKVNMAQ